MTMGTAKLFTENFLAQVEAEGGSGLPEFVKDDFDAFLACGILAHGFLRLNKAMGPGLLMMQIS